MEWGNTHPPIPSPSITPPAITSPFFCMICFISSLQLDNRPLHYAYSRVGAFMNGLLLNLLSLSVLLKNSTKYDILSIMGVEYMIDKNTTNNTLILCTTVDILIAHHKITHATTAFK